MAGPPSLERCLAYVVARDYRDWLGVPSPSGMEAFLQGALIRAQFTEPDFPA